MGKSRCNKALLELPTDPFELIGFSKGCSVINQILLDLSCKDKSERDGLDTKFLIDKIVYLDSGHNGMELFYPVQEICTNYILKNKINIEIWVSPYQMKQNKSKDIKQSEIDLMMSKIPGLVTVKKVDWESEPSLDLHFNVLSNFISEYTKKPYFYFYFSIKPKCFSVG